MEHQRCYVYDPAATTERATKRRRISSPSDPGQQLSRERTYREIWSIQEERIKDTLEEADRATLDKIVAFVSEISNTRNQERPSIPTGLVIAGPSIASHGPLFRRLSRRISEDTESTSVLLTSSDCPNLKTLLKSLIKKAIARVDDDDDEDVVQHGSSRRGPKLLDYDLGLLQEWNAKTRSESIVIAFQDSEAFDAHLLREAIDLLHSWLDRLPFVLLFGIATSSESFEDRLSGSSLRYLEGETFNVTQADVIIEKLFEATIANPDVSLNMGPTLSRKILDRQKDHVQSVQDFSDGLKYAYMSHFYANQLSIFLYSGLDFNDLPPELFEAARNLPSFRRYVEGLLDERQSKEVRNLLDSDRYLFQKILEHVALGQDALSQLTRASNVFGSIRKCLHIAPQLSISSIWTRAAAGELRGSPALRETLLSIKKVPSDRLVQLLDTLDTLERPNVPLDLEAYRKELDKLIKSNLSSTPLRSQHDIRNNSLRTTVVAQKVELSKQKAALSEQDKSYSELINQFHDDIAEYFDQAFIDPKSLFLSEIIMYDLRSPHSEAFNPRPRFAMERALASPHDYLNCDCCGDADRETEGVLSATQPATAIVYQLYLESGSLINGSDLWSAFNAIVGEREEEDESTTMALFQRALAELKYLGFIKPTKKKTDHISKMLWKGL